jgi:hypothetical protein
VLYQGDSAKKNQKNRFLNPSGLSPRLASRRDPELRQHEAGKPECPQIIPKNRTSGHPIVDSHAKVHE